MKGNYTNFFTDKLGNVINGASVTFYIADTTTKASLWSDRNGTTSIANPATTNANGEVDVYLNPGRYDLAATKDGVTTNLYDIVIDEEVDGVSELRACTPVSGDVLYLKFHTTAGDGGHGYFRGVTGAAASTYTDDGGITIVPTGGDGSAAWLRMYTYNINVKWFGVTGDGSTDDTANTQKALDAATTSGGVVVFPPGTYMINPTANTFNSDPYGIRIKSTTEVFLCDGATLKAITNDDTHYAVVAVFDADDVVIFGKGVIAGDRSTHTGVTGEWGHCLDVRNSDRVIVRDVHCKDAWGDGIYVGENTTSGASCTEVYIENVRASNNRRNNCSIVSCQGGGADGCWFDNANGTSPQTGLDIEPNTGNSVKDFHVSNCVSTGNSGHGFLLVGTAGSVNRVGLSGNKSISNTISGFTVKNADIAVVSGNHVQSNTDDGIRIDLSDDVVVSSNSVLQNKNGIVLDTASRCLVSGNEVRLNNQHGIYLETVSSENRIDGNIVHSNSQATNATYDNIIIDSNSDNNSVSNNTIRMGSLSNQPRYGINIVASSCEDNLISHNHNASGGVTANINNAGTRTTFSGNLPRTATATADDTTPSVLGIETLYLPANTGATAITALDNGVPHQNVTLAMTSSTNPATIADGGNFALSGDWEPGLHGTLTLTTQNGSTWRETGRSMSSNEIGSAAFNPSSLADGAGETTTVTVTGAALGDFAEASFSLDLQGITLTAWVSAADTVSVRFQNETGGTIDLASGTLRARVFKV